MAENQHGTTPASGSFAPRNLVGLALADQAHQRANAHLERGRDYARQARDELQQDAAEIAEPGDQLQLAFHEWDGTVPVPYGVIPY